MTELKDVRAVDPHNSKIVRFTDNSPKEGDFVPEEQIPKPLILGPDGAPYAAVYAEDSSYIGDGDPVPMTEADQKALEELKQSLKEEAYDDGQ